ncbi:MAG: ABC transporter ATP-binding protein [Gemmatimonadales bacterium]|nr:ABC transporter ATP-binding protein [Gemmatimonadales bacterium]
MSALRLEGLARRFGAVGAVDGVSLGVPSGGTLALLGPSGSGKTTTLRLLAGFERADAGRILVDGEDVTALPPERRRFGMVFPSYALFPHLDVAGTVAFGLECDGVRGEALRRRVGDALQLVDLAGYGARRVHELSGGQQQRVALARALAPAPRVLLLDEPLSNLDPALRERTRRELRELLLRAGTTTVLVTHEQEEAFDLADQVAVLRAGRVEQVGPPEALYQAPANRFVAGFVGRASELAARVVEVAAAAVAVELGTAGTRWSVPRDPSAPPATGDVVLVARPEALRVVAPDAPGALAGEVAGQRLVGGQVLLAVRTAAGACELWTDSRFAAGTRVGLAPSRRGRGGLLLFPGQP